MSDWFEKFSDNVEDNAGAFAAIGGMAHLKNQSAQRNELKKQRKLLQEQLASAKAAERSEKERLEIEQKRFELEQKEKDIRDKKDLAIKGMRKLMATVSKELRILDELVP